MDSKDLERELDQRGSAAISNGIVTQVTQAIDETEDKAKYLIFGEIRERSVIPIDKACAKCESSLTNGIHLGSIEKCQEFQAEGAKARGFTKVICPKQFVTDF